MLGSKFVKFFDDTIQGLNIFFGLSINDYCKLETTEPTSDKTIVGTDGTLCSLIEVTGSLTTHGDKDFERMAEIQNNSLHSKFSQAGHMMQVVFDYDPDIAKELVSNQLLASKNTARRLGFNIEEFFDDWEETLSGWCAGEKIYIALWTTPDCLSRREKGRVTRKMQKASAKTCPPLHNSVQSVGRFIKEIIYQHEGFVALINDTFHDLGIIANTLDAKSALREIRQMIDHSFTNKDWNPIVPGDKITVRYPEYGEETGDPVTFVYPSLAHQLFPREPSTIGKAVEIGDKLHQAILLTSPPQHPQAFNSLFTRMKDKKIPWRASFFIDPEGLKHQSFKHTMAQILQYGSSHNQRFVKAIDALKVQYDACHVRFRASFSTSVNKDQPNAMAKLSQNVGLIATTVQGWGSTDVTDMIGDGMLGVASTIPCLLQSNPAPNAAGPFNEILYMMPTTRPASPWKEGSIPLRTPDGKLIPFHPQSSKQSAWVDIGVAPMGQGKSVWLNTMNFGFIFQPGMQELPHLSIIDIGPSSKGLISLLRSLLPEEYQYLAMYERLKMIDEHSMNPFDTPLGCRKPLPNHRAYLVNLLSLFGTPLDEDRPQDGVAGLSGLIIDRAYSEFSDDVNPRKFQKNMDPKLFDLLVKEGFSFHKATTWWEIVDWFYDKGFEKEAIRAQRYAVPLLSELTTFLNLPIIKEEYNIQAKSGETITQFMYRSIMEAISTYPILNKPTQFDLGNAKIISLDLDEVAPKGGAQADRQTAVMYMLARHVTGSKFFMMPTDVNMIPQRYKEFHKKNIASIRKNPKRIAFDEFHRVSRNATIASQVVSDLQVSIRESRKWLLSVGIYTQDIQDIDDVMISLATQIYLFGAGDEKALEVLQDRFALSDIITQKLRQIGKPGRRGSNMVAIYKTDAGIFQQVITSTLGKIPLWAFSSTSEDMTIREELYNRIGVQKTLHYLARRYPGGVKPEVERRRQLHSTDSEQEIAVDVLEEIINEVHAEANTFDDTVN